VLISEQKRIGRGERRPKSDLVAKPTTRQQNDIGRHEAAVRHSTVQISDIALGIGVLWRGSPIDLKSSSHIRFIRSLCKSEKA
jgi:hypothetical protein